MKTYSLAAIAMAITSLAASGATVESRPGELHTLVSDAATVTELAITGTVNAADFFYIDANMPALRTLDISDCTIAPYSGAALGGISEYAAATIPAGVFAGSGLSSVALPANITIGNCAFAGTALTALAIPAGVTIGEGAFGGCRALTTVTLAADTRSGGYAFNNNTSLTGVDLAGCAAVGTADFAGCTALTAVTGTDGITAIGDDAFKGCSALAAFAFGPAVTTIGNSAFANSGLAAADFSSATALKSIGDWAFAYDTALASVAFAETAAITIGTGAFFDCTALTAISLPAGMTALPDYALKGLDSATEVVLPADVADIGNYALKGNASVTDLALPAALKNVGTGAMEGMSGLSSIDASRLAVVPSTGADVWSGVDQSAVKLTVPAGLADAFKTADQWQEFDIESAQTEAVVAIGNDTEAPRVRGVFDGEILLIEAIGADITGVELYDADGRLLARTAATGRRVAIDTASLSTRLFVVRCALDGGMVASIKIAK